MMKPSMTALVTTFARAYHTAHNAVPVFRDPLARMLLSDREHDDIARHMTPAEITAHYFAAHNRADPAHPMEAEAGANYCLAVKQP